MNKSFLSLFVICFIAGISVIGCSSMSEVFQPKKTYEPPTRAKLGNIFVQADSNYVVSGTFEMENGWGEKINVPCNVIAGKSFTSILSKNVADRLIYLVEREIKYGKELVYKDGTRRMEGGLKFVDSYVPRKVEFSIIPTTAESHTFEKYSGGEDIFYIRCTIWYEAKNGYGNLIPDSKQEIFGYRISDGMISRIVFK